MKADKEMIKWAGDIIKLMKGKTKDYSGASDNITAFGVYGVALRLFDKINRLLSLTDTDKTPANETVEDTLKDIIGYVFIIKMLRSGMWSEWLEQAGVSERFFIKKNLTEVVGYYLSDAKYGLREFLGLCFINDQVKMAIMRKNNSVHFAGRKEYIYFTSIRLRDVLSGVFSKRRRKTIIDKHNEEVLKVSSTVCSNNLESAMIIKSDKMTMEQIPCVWK